MRLVCSIMAAAAMTLSGSAFAQAKHGSKEEQEDAKRHRALAAAHEAAAKCLEAGKGEKACWSSCARTARASASASTAG